MKVGTPLIFSQSATHHTHNKKREEKLDKLQITEKIFGTCHNLCKGWVAPIDPLTIFGLAIKKEESKHHEILQSFT